MFLALENPLDLPVLGKTGSLSRSFNRCRTKCSATYESEKLIQLCECGAPLLVEYDLPKVQATLKKEMLKDREPTLWRYRELLPVKKKKTSSAWVRA